MAATVGSNASLPSQQTSTTQNIKLGDSAQTESKQAHEPKFERKLEYHKQWISKFTQFIDSKDITTYHDAIFMVKQDRNINIDGNDQTQGKFGTESKFPAQKIPVLSGLLLRRCNYFKQLFSQPCINNGNISTDININMNDKGLGKVSIDEETESKSKDNGDGSNNDIDHDMERKHENENEHERGCDAEPDVELKGLEEDEDDLEDGYMINIDNDGERRMLPVYYEYDVNVEAFNVVLKFLYGLYDKDSVYKLIHCENVCNVIFSARKYGINEIAQACYLYITTHTAVEHVIAMLTCNSKQDRLTPRNYTTPGGGITGIDCVVTDSKDKDKDKNTCKNGTDKDKDMNERDEYKHPPKSESISVGQSTVAGLIRAGDTTLEVSLQQALGRLVKGQPLQAENIMHCLPLDDPSIMPPDLLTSLFLTNSVFVVEEHVLYEKCILYCQNNFDKSDFSFLRWQDMMKTYFIEYIRFEAMDKGYWIKNFSLEHVQTVNLLTTEQMLKIANEIIRRDLKGTTTDAD